MVRKTFLIFFDLSVKRILGGWIGPFNSVFEIGELHVLQEKALLSEAFGPLFQRDIGILLLAISILLISLFYRYPDNHRQSAFVVFAFSASLLCLSLSGWYYRYFDYPDVIFRLHFSAVSLALTTQAFFVANYRNIRWATKVSRPLLFFGSLLVFVAESFLIRSVGVLLNVYLMQLLVLIIFSLGLYVLPLLRRQKLGSTSEKSYGIEISLFLIHFGSTVDIARIWKIHNFENISPYTYGIGIFVIGSVLASELVKIFQKAAQSAEAEALLRQSQRQTQFARQVGHDIRSPLSALNMMVGMLRDIPEDHRLLIKNSAQRINDIANTLLDRKWSEPKLEENEKTTETESSLAEPSKVVMLSSLVDSIVSEKRVQYRDRKDLSIEVDLKESYGSFSLTNSAELARAISNLINNSAEAILEKGKIVISLRSNRRTNTISIRDNGVGISEDVLATLGEIGVSIGKKNGSGLGIAHAKKVAEATGGNLQIFSVLGNGTEVLMEFPKSRAPAWFVDKLEIPESTKIVIVDDEKTVHQVWENRFSALNVNPSTLLSFTSPLEFREWRQRNELQKSIYLIDFEFLGSQINGLELIEELGLAKNAILVSSRAEDEKIQERATAINLRLLPKALSPLVPIVW